MDGGTSQTLLPSGGQNPYLFSIVSGLGTVDVATGQFTAPAVAGTTVVQVEDALGATSNVTIQNFSALSITPRSITVTAGAGQTMQFVGRGGSGGYGYSLVTGPGTLNATGLYAATNTSGTATVQVTDSLGTTASSTIHARRIRVNGNVYASVSDGTSLYVGGSFTAINPYSAPRLLIADASNGNPVLGCDLGSGFLDGQVMAVAASGTSLYVGGDFRHYNGKLVGSLAKIDSSTCALDTNFVRAGGFGNATGNSVSALALLGTSLYVAGDFTSYRGGNAPGVIKIDATSGDPDTAFLSGVGSGPNMLGGLMGLALAAGSVYVGGAFTNFNGSLVGGLVKLNAASGVVDVRFAAAPAADSQVYLLATDGTSLFAAGTFTHYAGIATSLAKINAVTGVVDSAFTQAVSNYAPGALLLNGGSLYVGNELLSGGRLAISKLDSTTAAVDSNFTHALNFDGSVLALALVGNSLYVGGVFTSYQNQPAGNLAKVDATTGILDTGFTQVTGVGGPVAALAIAGGNVLAGGNLSTWRGQPAQNLAKFTLATDAVDSAFTNATGPDRAVTALALGNGALYVGGPIFSYRGSAAGSLIKVDVLSGAMDSTFLQGAATMFWANSLLFSGGALYAGGYNASIGPTHLAKVDPTTGVADTTFASSGVPDGTVYGLASAGQSLYITGQFQHYGAAVAQNLAKIDATRGALDQTFTLATGIGDASTWGMTVLAAGSSVYVGGNFKSYRGVSVSGLVKLDATAGTLDTVFDGSAPVPALFVDALATDGTSLYALGWYQVPGAIPTWAIYKRSLASGMAQSGFAAAGAPCGTYCGQYLNTLTLTGTKLFIAASDSTVFLGTPVYFDFPIDTTSGNPLDQ